MNETTSNASPIVEEGIVAGNFYDKHGTTNPIARMMVEGFNRALDELVAATGAKDIHEVGCGEGHQSRRLAAQGYQVRGSDFSTQVIARANEISRLEGVAVPFKQQSIYELKAPEDAAPLIVCCEVLEHLEQPEEALKVLKTLASPHLIVSVPREPLWRVLNCARGKYIADLGNTPGHIQHWSRGSFVRMLEKHVKVERVLSPLPWTMVLCRV